jgi:hypothetical protein
VAAAGVTVIVGLAIAVTDGVVLSVAVRVHEVPVVIATPLKVATPELAATGEAPVNVHVDESAIVSLAVAPVAVTLLTSCSVTLKFVRTAPATVDVTGPVVYAR